MLLAEFTATQLYQWFTGVFTGLLTIVPWVFVLFSMQILDIATGWLKFYISGTLSSSSSREGVMRKVMVQALVAAGHLVEILFALALAYLPESAQLAGGLVSNFQWSAFIAFLFCLTEFLSIIENAHGAGVPIPKKLVDAFAVVSHNEIIGKGKSRDVNINVHSVNIDQATAQVKSDIEIKSKPQTQPQTQTPQEPLTEEEQQMVDHSRARQEERNKQ